MASLHSQKNTKKKVLIQQVLLLVSVAAVSATVPIAKPGCPDSCGDLTIPYPYGTRKGCYLDDASDDTFLITCNSTTNTNSTTHTPFLRHGNLEVLSISLDGQLRINSKVAVKCYNKQGSISSYHHTWVRVGKLSSLSYSLNKFVAVGCDTIATIEGFTNPDGYRYSTSCSSYCYSNYAIVNGSCSGVGCCELSIPKGARGYNISLKSYDNHEDVINYNPCSYAFVVEDGFYNFSSLDLVELQTIKMFPVVLDWTVGNTTCAEAKTNQTAYACKDQNSVCLDSDKRSGYLCNCSVGFHGNPYLSNGCQDNDECANPSLNDCASKSNCTNTMGSYTCICPKGYQGDGRKNGQGCIANFGQSLQLEIIVGVSVAVSAILVVLLLLICGIKKKEMRKLREKNFKENGGLMLQQLLSQVERSEEKAKIFTENELNKATNNFNKSEIIGQGGYGTVYKGILENKTVAIKKSKVMDHDQIEQFVNEVIVLSQIKHPNVVKLLGCCLEAPVPLLVYEFITNNTLYHHLHNREKGSLIGWEVRLNIALQTANALAHMHFDAPIHIIHRDVKSANILLDDNFQAKVSDFGVSRLVPLDQTQLSTLVQGTLGYIDPEYFHSGLLNDKSDVYSFGVVLVELLTGKKVICPERPENEKNLAGLFISTIKEDKLYEILDERVKNEGHPKQLEGFANLARRCIRFKREKRPTMKEVKRELEVIRIYKRSEVKVTVDIEEEAEPLLRGTPTELCSSSITTEFDSTKYQASMELETGR